MHIECRKRISTFPNKKNKSQKFDLIIEKNKN